MQTSVGVGGAASYILTYYGSVGAGMASVAAAWRRRAVACARGVGGGRAAGAIAGAAFPLSTQTGTKCDLRAC